MRLARRQLVLACALLAGGALALPARAAADTATAGVPTGGTAAPSGSSPAPPPAPAAGGAALVARYYAARTIRGPVIDRGPYANGASWDLTLATANWLRFTSVGIDRIGALVVTKSSL